MLFVSCADDWVADGYRWYNAGCDRLPRRAPTMYKRKFQALTNDGPTLGFKRVAYTACESSEYIVVQYLGDETLAESLPHGNVKDGEDARPFQRTTPSVLTRLAQQTSSQKPSVVHKTACTATTDVTEFPRDYKQVRNLRDRVQAGKRLTADGLSNLHEIAYDIPDFVWLINTFPDIVVVAGRELMLQQMNKLLNARSQQNIQLLSYDTTFNFGEFYLSVLLFRGVCFRENPVFPVLFMLHERKQRKTHQKFVEILAEHVPAINSSNVVLVTDGEEAFNVFESAFPKLNKVFCWNHILGAAKDWLHKHGATSTDIAVYTEHIKTLLHEPTIELYNEAYIEKAKLWSQPFKEYFSAEIHPHMGTKLGRVILEQLNVYNPRSGITQNTSEGFNTVMRRMRDWEEAPFDVTILSLFQLQSFYLNSINMGLCDRGDYHLLKEFHHLRITG